jgi:hypothetical protein
MRISMVCTCYNNVLSLMVLNKSAIGEPFRRGEWLTARDMQEAA